MTQRNRTKIKILHPRYDIDYICQDRGRGFPCIKDTSVQWQNEYIKKNNKKRPIAAATNSICSISTNRPTKTRKQEWEEQQVYGYFMWQISRIVSEKTWIWLEKGEPKERNWISFNSSTRKRHKYQLLWCENW